MGECSEELHTYCATQDIWYITWQVHDSLFVRLVYVSTRDGTRFWAMCKGHGRDAPWEDSNSHALSSETVTHSGRYDAATGAIPQQVPTETTGAKITLVPPEHYDLWGVML